MDNRFPTMLYLFPALAVGDPTLLQDGAYSTTTVHDDEQHAAALAEGWHETPGAAREAHEEAKAAEAARIAGNLVTGEATAISTGSGDDIKPATRDELEQKATELGIAFNARTSDKKLAAEIAAKLAG